MSENEEKEKLMKFDQIDNEISQIKKTITPYLERMKVLKKEKINIRDDICLSMLNAEKSSVEYNLPNSVSGTPAAFTFAVSERTQGLTIDSIGNLLLKFFDATDIDEFNEKSNAQKANEIVSYLSDTKNRNKKTLFTTKRANYKE